MQLLEKNSSSGLGLLCALLVAAALHYLLTPSESEASGLLVQAIRWGSGLLVVGMLMCLASFDRRTSNLWGTFGAIICWLIIINFPENLRSIVVLSIFMAIAFLIVSFAQQATTGAYVRRALDLVLLFWLGSLVLQVVLFFLDSTVVDVHRFFHPLSEARVGSVGEFVRFTGVHIEPGTYANWTFGLVILRSLASGRLFDPLNIAAASSMVVTLSAWGVLASALYFFVMFVQLLEGRRGSKRMALVAGSLALVAVGLIGSWSKFDRLADTLDYFYARAELADASGQAKLAAYTALESRLYDLLFFGWPFNVDFCNNCSSPQDAGVFVNLVVRGGLVFAIIVFWVIARGVYRAHGIFAVALVGVLALGKYFYFDPIVWLIFAFSLLLRQNRGVGELDSGSSLKGPGVHRSLVFGGRRRK